MEGTHREKASLRKMDDTGWQPFMYPLRKAVGYATLLLNRPYADVYEITLCNLGSR